MSDVIDTKREWERELLSSFVGVVQADYGDFVEIDRLAKACFDVSDFQKMIENLSASPQGKKAFEKRFSLSGIDLEQLRQLPPGTLGRAYADHMIRNQLEPLQAPPVESDYQFLGNHLRETHDIWHIVTGSDTDVFGEIQLEAFCVAQFEISRFWLALVAKNLLKSVLNDIESSNQCMEALTKGWLMGKKAKPLFGIDWSTLWETPLEEVRASLEIDT